MPSLNDRSKLKGQYTDAKSGSGISVGPSDTVPLKHMISKYINQDILIKICNCQY